MKKQQLGPVGQRILITGGAGFIGTSLALRLAEDNEVVLFDRAFEDSPYSYSDLTESALVECVEGSVLDEAALRDAVVKADIVIHLAAVVGVKEVLRQARRTLEVNFEGTANVLRSIPDPAALHRFVFLSTSEIFGANSFRVHERVESTIGSVNEARWSYSAAKLAAEHLVQAYFEEEQLPSVTIRPFNVFGPLRVGDHAIKRFVQRAQAGRPLEVHGDGNQIRSWCYIDDFIDATLRALVVDRAVGETFNIGNARNTLTIYDLAKTVIRVLDSPSTIEFMSVDFSDIDIRVPRTDRARDLLGYNPSHELEEALRVTAEWYRDHLSGV